MPRPITQSVIGTKWMFRNKLDEKGNIIRIAKGYSQEEGIASDETFVPVAKLESICMCLCFCMLQRF